MSGTVRKWVRQAQVDAGVRAGVSSQESAEVRKLRAEIRELWRVMRSSRHNPHCSAADYVGSQVCVTVATSVPRAKAPAWICWIAWSSGAPSGSSTRLRRPTMVN